MLLSGCLVSTAVGVTKGAVGAVVNTGTAVGKGVYKGTKAIIPGGGDEKEDRAE